MRNAYLERLIERNPCDAVEGIKRSKPDQRENRRAGSVATSNSVHSEIAERGAGRQSHSYMARRGCGVAKGKNLGIGLGRHRPKKAYASHTEAVRQREDT